MQDKSISFDFESNQVEMFTKKNCKELLSIIEKIEYTINKLYKRKYQFSIYFVSSETIRNLNNQYRSKNEVTDVLSFSEIDLKYPFKFYAGNKKEFKNQNIAKYIGEIIICIDKIIERAEIEEDTIENTLVYMIFHSFLHLLGYTHDNEGEYKIIESKTYELLRRYISIWVYLAHF